MHSTGADGEFTGGNNAIYDFPVGVVLTTQKARNIC